MTPEMNASLPEEELFAEALELPPEARGKYLDEKCGSDAAMRSRIERLLKARAVDARFLERPAVAAGLKLFGALNVHSDEEIGSQIGPYRIKTRLGEGGCGTVYLAEQDKPIRREVALKVIKLGMDTKR